MELVVPFSGYNAGDLVAGEWTRGTPTPIGPNTGIPNPADLFSMSPPTLLEEFEIISYALPFGIQVANSAGFTNAPELTVELAFLVNGDVRHINQQQPNAYGYAAPDNYNANGAWIADLVNPIHVGARERLAIRVGVLSDDATTGGNQIYIAGQVNQAAGEASPGSITYNVIQLPGSRRL